MSDAAKKAKQKMGSRKTKARKRQTLRGIFFVEPNDEEFKLAMKAARRKLDVPMQRFAKYRQRAVEKPAAK